MSVLNQAYLVGVELPVCSDIEEAAGCVVRTSSKSVSIREELDGVDIRFVPSKRLHRLSGTDIPELGECIASTRNEYVLVGRVDADRHDIAKVVSELGNLRPRLDIP